MAVEFEVLGFINDPHSAAAKFFQNFIMRDGFTEHMGFEQRCYAEHRLKSIEDFRLTETMNLYSNLDSLQGSHKMTLLSSGVYSSLLKTAHESRGDFYDG